MKSYNNQSTTALTIPELLDLCMVCCCNSANFAFISSFCRRRSSACMTRQATVEAVMSGAVTCTVALTVGNITFL